MVDFKNIEHPEANSQLTGLQYRLNKNTGVGTFKLPGGQSYTVEILKVSQENLKKLSEADWEVIALKVAVILREKNLLTVNEATIKRDSISAGNKEIFHDDLHGGTVNTARHADELFQYVSSKFNPIQIENFTKSHEKPSETLKNKHVKNIENKKLRLFNNKKEVDLVPILNDLKKYENSQLFVEVTSGKNEIKTYIINPNEFDPNSLKKVLKSLKEEGDFILKMQAFTLDPDDSQKQPISEIIQLEYSKEFNSITLTQKSLLIVEYQIKILDIKSIEGSKAKSINRLVFKPFEYDESSNTFVGTTGNLFERADELFQLLENKRVKDMEQSNVKVEDVQNKKLTLFNNKKEVDLVPILNELKKYENSQLFVEVSSGENEVKTYIIDPKEFDPNNLKKVLNSLKEEGDFILKMQAFTLDPDDSQKQPISQILQLEYSKEINSINVTQKPLFIDEYQIKVLDVKSIEGSKNKNEIIDRRIFTPFGYDESSTTFVKTTGNLYERADELFQLLERPPVKTAKSLKDDYRIKRHEEKTESSTVSQEFEKKIETIQDDSLGNLEKSSKEDSNSISKKLNFRLIDRFNEASGLALGEVIKTVSKKAKNFFNRFNPFS